MAVAAIIPARGGSKGIPNKNIIDFCGKPLVSWSIEHALKARGVDSVWVSSDSNEILSIASRFGARMIRRPDDISGDQASSESAWIHAVGEVERFHPDLELVIGMQATSPIREAVDLERALELFRQKGLDSLFTSARFHDFFIWHPAPEGGLIGFNHDYKNRKRRQDIEENFLENGSFYIFRPDNLKKWNNRLGGLVGTYVMEDYKKFQVDSPEDLRFCEVIMKGYGLAG